MKLNINKENAQTILWVLYINLIIGIYNIYLYVSTDNWTPLVIGALNIWVWVFHREEVNKYLG